MWAQLQQVCLQETLRRSGVLSLFACLASLVLCVHVIFTHVQIISIPRISLDLASLSYPYQGLCRPPTTGSY